MKSYDVVIVGAGHAGCEAAMAAARGGASVLLTTINMDHIALMSCNPAIGGIAKGQVVREIDACGGVQGIVTDSAAIQFRMLNQAKGPAVRSPRSQCDKSAYSRAMKCYLEMTENIDILQCEIIDILYEDDKIIGVVNQFNDTIFCSAVVLTTGTFLNGRLHYGMTHFPGGRAGDAPSSLSKSLAESLGLKIGRLKTGTPPRILAKTIDFSDMAEQKAEIYSEEFSFWSKDLIPELPSAKRRNFPCHLVYTNENTASIVRENLHLSPTYQGKIKGIGTRYCPSFEDKIVRFPDHPRHLLYLEPEGAETSEYYINGISSGLPPEIQRAMIHSVKGLENAVISRYAYAIEYDFLYPDQLERTLRLKKYQNLFSAGQINGTSGYEEAAGQGLVAGMNAALYAKNSSLLEFGRDSSYIGVMIDDLCTKEIIEPYRLFTSRAEYRLHLRQDNADLRLSEFAYKHGFLPENKYRYFCEYSNLLAEKLEYCRTNKKQGKPLLLWLKNGEEECEKEKLELQLPENHIGEKVWEQLLVEAKYDGYLQRENIEIQKLKKMEYMQIPKDLDYKAISGLSFEARSKLISFTPTTIAQASRIDGVTPADIALLQIKISQKKAEANSVEASLEQ